MAREMKVTKAYNSGLHNRDTGERCAAEKVVNVTEDCPKAKKDRCIFLYTRTKRGRIVQMKRPFKGEKYSGVRIPVEFFVDELDTQMHTTPFNSWAGELGLTRRALRELIEKHAPPK